MARRPLVFILRADCARAFGPKRIFEIVSIFQRRRKSCHHRTFRQARKGRERCPVLPGTTLSVARAVTGGAGIMPTLQSKIAASSYWCRPEAKAALAFCSAHYIFTSGTVDGAMLVRMVEAVAGVVPGFASSPQVTTAKVKVFVEKSEQLVFCGILRSRVHAMRQDSLSAFAYMQFPARMIASHFFPTSVGFQEANLTIGSVALQLQTRFGVDAPGMLHGTVPGCKVRSLRTLYYLLAPSAQCSLFYPLSIGADSTDVG